jgi:hypothetical protein
VRRAARTGSTESNSYTRIPMPFACTAESI